MGKGSVWLCALPLGALLLACGGRSGAEDTTRRTGAARDGGASTSSTSRDGGATGDDDVDVTPVDDDMTADDDSESPTNDEIVVDVPVPGMVTPAPPEPPVEPEDETPPAPTVPGPIEEPPIEEPPLVDPTLDPNPLLVYVAPRVYNLRDGSSWASLSAPILLMAGAAPWSADGQWLVDGTSSGIVFLERTDVGFVDAGISVPVNGTLRRWLASRGVLLNGGDQGDELWYAGVEGDAILLAASEYRGTAGHAASADGNEVLFSSTGEGQYPLMHVSIKNGEASAPEALITDGGSPILSQLWSSDGKWLAFGISGGTESGIYAWSPASPSAVVPVTPVGTPYNPLYSFARGHNTLAVYASFQQSELGVFSLDAERSWQTVATGGTATPADWSWDGGFLQHGTMGDAQLVPVSSSGVIGSPVPFADATYGCSLHWVSPTTFYYRQCGATDGDMYFGEVASGAVTTELVAEQVPPYFVRSPSGKCFVNYSSTELRVGAFLPSYVETAQWDSTGPSFFAFAPDDSAVVWHDGGGVRFAMLDDGCAPTEENVLSSITPNSNPMFLP